MLSYSIDGVREGSLQAEKDGLYWNVSASCSRDWEYPIRLIAETDGMQVVLGVPLPEQDGLHLHARISNRSCPFTEQTRILTDQTPEPKPVQAEEPELLPFEPTQPFDRISEFSVMDVVEQDGKPYGKTPD